MPAAYKGFASLLYYHLIHSGRHQVAVVAAALGVTGSALYKYCEGDSTFPPDLLPALYNATHEREFLDFCLKGTDQMPCARPPVGGQARERSLEMETLDVATAVGLLSANIQHAIEDGRLSDIETRKIERVIAELFCQVEEVRQKVRSLDTAAQTPLTRDNRRVAT